MDVSKLEKGMVIKNYKALCLLINEPVKKANSKKAQLKKLSTYVRFEKKGQKFLIKEVYDKKLTVIEKRGGNNTKILDTAEKSFMHLLATAPIQDDDNRVLIVTRMQLFKALGYFGENYEVGINKKRELGEYLGIDHFTINYFYDKTYSKASSSVERMLKSMKRQRNLFYDRERWVCTMDNKHRKTTDYEDKCIIDIEKELINYFNCKDIVDIYAQHKTTEYYSLLNKEIKDKLDLNYTYIAYRIILSSEYAGEVISESMKLIESGETDIKLYQDLNNIMAISNKKSFEKSHKKYKDREYWGELQYTHEKIMESDKFIADGEKLFDVCGDINSDIELLKEMHANKQIKK